MKITRRNFLSSSAAAMVLPAVPVTAQVPYPELVAQVNDVQLLPEGYDKTTLWGFGGRTPGSEIRLKQGERVQRTLSNTLPQPTSVHWHGIRIDNTMDGVAGLTQEAVQANATFDYDFVVPDAGTYWYHAHNRSTEQVARGLYGALIVEEHDAIDIDREEVLILDDWLVNPETAQIDSDFNAGHSLSHAGRIGNYITTNGKYGLTLSANKHERLRLRLINASNARIFTLALNGLEGWTLALDGMPLVEPQPVTEAILMGPGQRVDLIVDVVAEVGEVAHLVHLDRNEAVSQVAFTVEDGTTARRVAPSALPSNSHTMVDLNETLNVQLKMEGGAMGGLRSASLGGDIKSMRELVDTGRYWAFNGAADGIDGEPLMRVSLGEHVRLTINNDTAFPHAMHLHGMHFHEIAAGGGLGPLRDTTLVERGASRDIAFVADNPGEWLFHCHMLSHGASGMMTRIVVG